MLHNVVSSSVLLSYITCADFAQDFRLANILQRKVHVDNLFRYLIQCNILFYYFLSCHSCIVLYTLTSKFSVIYFMKLMYNEIYDRYELLFVKMIDANMLTGAGKRN